MASKIYTAQEMRAMADKLPDDYSFADIVSSDGDKQLFSMGCLSSMLRQAADIIEREAKRDKKYEYSVHPADVYGVYQHRSAAELNVEVLKTTGIRAHLVRREIGEWEEVRDGE